MKIVATEVLGRDLKPGDLFSTANQFYWDHAHHSGSVGEKVYIRTETPSRNASDENESIYRITIEHDEEATP